NLEAFRRWYGDPEVARLTRYQDGPMRTDEIDRFFTARVIGLDSLALAVHVKETNRLIGSCAFSQLDGDNGSGLFHITIGEKDCWGRGYGTEATRPRPRGSRAASQWRAAAHGPRRRGRNSGRSPTTRATLSTTQGGRRAGWRRRSTRATSRGRPCSTACSPTSCSRSSRTRARS